jgi:hypothetical protein
MSRILAGALVTAAALAGTVYWEVQDSAAPDPAVTTGRTPVAGLVHAAPGPETSDVMQGWVSTALARPLFREDRRPIKTAVDAGLKGDGPIRLAGVITGPTGNRAIFVSGESVKPIVAMEGAHVGDFVVRSIEPGHVVVDSDGMVRTLNLSFSDAAKTPRP